MQKLRVLDAEAWKPAGLQKAIHDFGRRKSSPFLRSTNAYRVNTKRILTLTSCEAGKGVIMLC